jgi:hypothetical protein
MDRKARNSVLFGPSIHGGTGQARPTGIISPAGHTYRHLSRVELEHQPSATRVRSVPGVILSDAASWSERRRVVSMRTLVIQNVTRPAIGQAGQNPLELFGNRPQTATELGIGVGFFWGAMTRDRRCSTVAAVRGQAGPESGWRP